VPNAAGGWPALQGQPPVRWQSNRMDAVPNSDNAGFLPDGRAPERGPDRGCRLRLSPLASILRLDTTSSEQMYQVILGHRRTQISRDVFSLLQFLRAARERGDVLSFLRELAPDEDPQKLCERLLGQLRALGIVVEVDDAGCDVPGLSQTVSRRRHPLLFHLRLFRRDQLLPVTSCLKHLFRNGPATILLSLIILCHAVFFLADRIALVHHAAGGRPISAGEWVVLVAGVYLSLLIHELGHCSACERFGAEHGEIGAGIYFIYPVFYADVAQCWSLPRMRRAAVDAAGVYFQLLLSALGCLAWILTGHRLVKIFVYSSAVTVLFNMNPFLRFDGYWLLADLSGIPGLRRAANEVIGYLLTRLKSGSPTETPEVLRRPGWVSITLVLYCIGSAAFFVYFALQVTCVVIPRITVLLPRTLADTWMSLVRLELSARFAQRLFVSLFLIIAAVGVGRFLMRLGGWLWTCALVRIVRAALRQRVATYGNFRV